MKKNELRTVLISFSVSLGLWTPTYIKINQTSKQLDELCVSADELSNSDDELYNSVDELEAEIDILTTLHEQIDTLSNDVEDLEKRVNYLYQTYQEYELFLSESGKEELEYSEMRENLLKVKEKLNISPEEDLKYASVLSIGDAMNLVDESVPIYKDIYSVYSRENATTSYYGQSEARYIEVIIMTDENLVIEVDNMNDYEMYLHDGFVVIGYGLVNQYSLDENGNLTKELCCEEDGIKLIFEKKGVCKKFCVNDNFPR